MSRKPVDPNQALLDAVVAQRNDAQNALAKCQAELAVAMAHIELQNAQLSEAVDKIAGADASKVDNVAAIGKQKRSGG